MEACTIDTHIADKQVFLPSIKNTVSVPFLAIAV